ncbi:MAG: exodeoxyribonuclease V subunit beta, partial [bacterium]|nr:exodeoxyribonuclease V subunit beta [bacterium]
GLVRGVDTERPDYDAVAPADSIEVAAQAEDELFDLPAGSQFGSFLHELLEHLDFHQTRGEEVNQLIQEQLLRHGLDTGEKDRLTAVAELLDNVLDTSLDDEARIRLRDVGSADRLAELEFHFSLAEISPARLRAVLSASPDYADTAKGLNFGKIRGLIHGFIDLVFRHDGLFYVVDYKSNLLGRQLSDYARSGMRETIRKHRYDLQYLIYTLALHRF